ncbi:MAG: hypothetical protein O2807_07635 [bacterium]|nr:hypothetical protein [bacterium]
MINGGKLTVNGWLFVLFLVLVFTTPFNPIINNRYFTLWWYPIVALYGIWVLYRIVYDKEVT